MAEKTERLKRERATTGNVWVDSFRKVFSFDLRSLALFRIAIGSVLIADLILRFQTIREMYTWEGVLPAELAQNTYSLLSGQDVGNFVWSLHWLNDTYAFQVTMFAIAALFAGLMIVGKWTRLATIVSWILLVSLHVRNPIILTSGDYFLKLILFWSIFLPLGARWSLDARQQPGRYPNGQIASLASAGFLLQLIFMYFFTGFAKLNADWYSGDAMYYVLGLEIYVTEIGAQLVQYPGLLKVVSWATLFVEVIFIWTLLSTRWNGVFRYLNIIAYWSFHIGIAFCMKIGLFPFICMIAWLPLLPPSFWKLFGMPSADEAPKKERIDQPLWVNAICSVLIAFVLLWNIFNIEHTSVQKVARMVGWQHVVPIGLMLKLDQHFQMFGQPPKTNPWFVYEATLRDGTNVDLHTHGPVDHSRPDSVRLTLNEHHWRKLHRNLVLKQFEKMRQPLADYYVRKWNREHGPDQQVVKMRLLCYQESIGPDYNQIDRVAHTWGSFSDGSENGSLFDQFSDQIKNQGDQDPVLPF